MNEIKLKPCPFCGGKPYLETNHRAFINAKTTKVAYVWCRNCNARTERIPLEKYGKTSHSLEAESDAIKAWNKRAEKTGQWIPHKASFPIQSVYSCSKCNSSVPSNIFVVGCDFEFCPYCGAKMESEDVNND